MQILNRLRMLRLFVSLVRDPNRTDLIFEAVNVLIKEKELPVVVQLEARLLAVKEFKSLYEQNALSVLPTMEKLAAMPADSLGQKLHEHLSKNNLDLSLFPKIETIPTRPIEYLNARLYQEHDLWHALLGYGVSVEDELALQAFSVAQFGAPLGVLIISGGLLHLIGKSPERAVAAVGRLSEGYMCGKSAKFLLSEQLFTLLDRPIADVRALCKLSS